MVFPRPYAFFSARQAYHTRPPDHRHLSGGSRSEAHASPLLPAARHTGCHLRSMRAHRVPSMAWSAILGAGNRNRPAAAWRHTPGDASHPPPKCFPLATNTSGSARGWPLAFPSPKAPRAPGGDPVAMPPRQKAHIDRPAPWLRGAARALRSTTTTRRPPPDNHKDTWQATEIYKENYPRSGT